MTIHSHPQGSNSIATPTGVPPIVAGVTSSGIDPYEEFREYSPLKALGYTTGCNGGLRRNRQRLLRCAYRVDLKVVLDPEEYLKSGAEDWGLPESGCRLARVFRQVACQVNRADHGGWHDCARHLREDLRYLIDEICPDHDWSWRSELWFQGVSL